MWKLCPKVVSVSISQLAFSLQTNLEPIRKNMAIDKFMTRLVTAGWSCWHLHQFRFVRVLSRGVLTHHVESKTLPPSLRWKFRGKSPSLSPTKQNSKLLDFDAFHTCTFEQKFCSLQCTMCILGTTMALWSKAEIQKYTFWWEKNIFEAIFPMLF